MCKLRCLAAMLSFLICLSLAACHGKETTSDTPDRPVLPNVSQEKMPSNKTDTQDQEPTKPAVPQKQGPLVSEPTEDTTNNPDLSLPADPTQEQPPESENTPPEQEPSSSEPQEVILALPEIQIPMTAVQRLELQSFLREPETARLLATNKGFDIDHPWELVVLDSEIDSSGNFRITYAKCCSGTYVLTLGKTDAGYLILSDEEVDLNADYEKALTVYRADPENERDIGDLQTETMAICRLDDGKYYQLFVASNHDCVQVFVSEAEITMSARWDWLVIGPTDSFTVDNLGKIKETGATEVPEGYIYKDGHLYKI